MESASCRYDWLDANQLKKAERIGIEPTSVPVAGTDNGFEDREDHQAPFTLRIADCELRIAKRLFCFLDCRDNGVEIRPIAGVEFGME